MPNYDFKSLSPVDFEVLVRDLLQEELNVRLESFRSGRDLGIDFRYSLDAGGEIIVQCKHYADSTFAKLLSDLRKRELPKIESCPRPVTLSAHPLALTRRRRIR